MLLLGAHILNLALLRLSQLHNLSQAQVYWLVVGIFQLRHLRQHIVEPGRLLAVEGLGREFRAVLATEGLGIVRLLGLNAGLGREVGGKSVGGSIIKGLVLTVFFHS